MRILLVSVLKPDAPSGVRVHYLALAQALRRRGHRVDVLTPADLTGWRRQAVAVLRHILRRLGPAAALAAPLSDYLHLRFALPPGRHYDVVNAQDPVSGLAAARALGGQVPVVVTGHHNDHPADDDQRQRPRPVLAAQLRRQWHDYFLARTRYFLAVSGFGLARLRAYLPGATLCQSIHNGIDFEKFTPRLLTSPDPPLLLNIGQLESRKNQLLLVEAAHHLRQHNPHFRLALAGDGPDAPALRARIAALNLGTHVQLLGYRANVAPLLAQARLYVHTATHETFGLVLVEAIAAGTPALALAVGGVPEVLAATPEALLPPTISAPELAQHIQSWLASPQDLKTLHTKQFNYAERHFSQARMVDETLAFYSAARSDFRRQFPAPQPRSHPFNIPRWSVGNG